jgi:uncharacterized protein YbjT (DUF2867 family)
MNVTVIGATGFVGSHLVPHLVGRGHRVRAVSRTGRRLDWPPEVEAVAGDVETGAGLDDALRGTDALVHLVAIPRELHGRRFAEVNVLGVERVIEAARRNQVARIVHLSALGVADDPHLGFLFSKWRGEQLVRESGLDWRVLRPSLLFGPGDGFFNLIKTTLTWWSPGVVAIPGTGNQRFQPLSVHDLALAVEACLTDPARASSVYELGGPEYVTYGDIVDRVMRATGKRRLKLTVPVPLISAVTSVTDRILPILPVSHDQVSSLSRPNYAEIGAFERAFGIEPRPIDLGYLR